VGESNRTYYSLKQNAAEAQQGVGIYEFAELRTILDARLSSKTGCLIDIILRYFCEEEPVSI
jgi:hypothetical protein